MKIIPQEERLLKSLKDYYIKKPNSVQIVYNIVTQKTGVSLRLLDWIVTNYSKSNNTKYEHNGNIVNVYKSYKGELDAYSKKKFDPFCRRERIFYNTKLHSHIKISSADKKYKNFLGKNYLDDGFITTVGQLNFFRWAIENGIIIFALDNLEDLEKNMLDTTKSKKLNSSKRKQLTPNLSKSMTTHRQKILVKFD